MLNYQRVIVGFVKTKIVRGFNGGFKHQVNGNFSGIYCNGYMIYNSP
jgi:hypothetical protein